MLISAYVGEGPVEHEEDMPLMTDDNYEHKIRLWLDRWIETIREMYGDEPEGSELKIKANHHDFGTYYSVEYYYDDACAEHEDYCHNVVNDPREWLTEWDDIWIWAVRPDWHEAFG